MRSLPTAAAPFALALACSALALAAPASAADADWTTFSASVRHDKIADGDACWLSVMTQGPDNATVSMTLGVVKNDQGQKFVKAQLTTRVGAGKDRTAPTDFAFLTGAQEKNGGQKDNHGDLNQPVYDDGGYAMGGFDLKPDTWMVLDGLGRDGVVRVAYVMPDGKHVTAVGDLTTGKASPAFPSLAADPKDNPKAFADCLKDMQLR